VRGVQALLGFGDDARPGGAVGQIRRRRGGAAQQRALVFAIGPVRRLPEPADGLAVGLDQGHVDAVLRRAAHQPDRQNRRRLR
jgi:hypothetical protein